MIPVVPDPGLAPLPQRGRGTTWNPAHRFTVAQRQPEDDGWGSLELDAQDEAVAIRTEVREETVVSILSENDSPDIGFDLSINPYRGCEHGCIYCYARPTHSWLGGSPGLDFETRIVAKVNAASCLESALSARSYRPRYLNIGSVTDAYQPVERRLRITRGVLEVMSRAHHPFSLITKGSGVLRDLDILQPMAGLGLVAVYVSITTLDDSLARILEPRAAAPWRRLEVIRRLAAAGVPVGVSVSPMIPFINEPELERILEAARDAGAGSAFSIVLRLPLEVSPLFQQWLQTHYPQRADRVMARVREMHGGQDYNATFGQRMRGSGVWASLLRQRFDKACARLGYRTERTVLDFSHFRAPGPAGQAQLF
ncbi:MAG: PA0069 family radical SAM protein [Aquabacterium sp.]